MTHQQGGKCVFFLWETTEDAWKVQLDAHSHRFLKMPSPQTGKGFLFVSLQHPWETRELQSEGDRSEPVHVKVAPVEAVETEGQVAVPASASHIPQGFYLSRWIRETLAGSQLRPFGETNSNPATNNSVAKSAKPC